MKLLKRIYDFWFPPWSREDFVTNPVPNQQAHLAEWFARFVTDAYKNGETITIIMRRGDKTFPVGCRINKENGAELMEYLANWASAMKLREDGSEKVFCNPLDLL
jgi:hypothetical protein